MTGPPEAVQVAYRGEDPMPEIRPFIAVTDRGWFDFLSSCAGGGRLDEVNFWSPRAIRPIKNFRPGDPFFFRLKQPVNAIVGEGASRSSRSPGSGVSRRRTSA